MFKGKKVDATQAAIWTVAGLVAAAILPAEWNPVLVVKNAIENGLKKKKAP